MNTFQEDDEEKGDFEEDETLPPRSDYELQRAENVKKNLEILSNLGLVSFDCVECIHVSVVVYMYTITVKNRYLKSFNTFCQMVDNIFFWS